MADMRIDSKITIIDPTPEIRAWCKRNLELPNPEYEKKVRMNKWVGNTPKIVKLYEQNGSDLILPYGCWDDVAPMIDGSKMVHNRTYDHYPMQVEFTPVKLFDYQAKAVHAMYTKGAGILQSPAGSGKTQCAIAMIQRYRTKTLWITHTQDLLKQSMDRAKQFIPEKYLGTITEGQVNIGSWITFATVQTLCNIDLQAHKFDWDVIICDECHRISGSPTTVTMYYKVLGNLAALHKYGLSATLHRADGMIKACYALIGSVKYVVPDEAVAGRIMQLKIKPIETGCRPGIECLNFDGTLDYQKMLTSICENHQRNQLIAMYASLESENHSILILSNRIKHLKDLYELLPDSVKAMTAMVDGKMVSKKEKAKRAEYLEQMRTGEKKVLLATYQLAKEGLDIPRLDRLYMVTPQKDLAVIVQSIGRIARVCEGKGQPVVYDFVDANTYCQKAYKKRYTIYKKQGCEII